MRHDVHDVAGSMLRGSSAVKINKLAIFGAARHRCKRDSGIFASAPDVSMSGLGTKRTIERPMSAKWYKADTLSALYVC